MDLETTSKLLKYSPSDVQSVTYVIEYAEHNFTGEARYAYLEERLVTPTEKAIAEVIIEGKKGLWANIHAKRKRGELLLNLGIKIILRHSTLSITRRMLTVKLLSTMSKMMSPKVVPMVSTKVMV